ncbi:hypothetical protein HK105_203375 [Polyrhizophydium stewartii]|uniref:Uncharacterized protein n=1 Tax=Polyrhizophydium stewartii TaxID=2732419 RepID=A0ABR4NBM7_9FUNG
MVIPRLTPTDGIEDSNQSRRLVAIDSDEDNDLTGRHAAFDAHDRKGRGAGIFVNDFGSVTPRKRGNDEIESSDGSSDAAPFDGFVDIQKLKQTGQPLGSLARYLDQFSADAKHKRRQASTKGGHAARQSRASTTGGGARAIQVDDDNDDDGIIDLCVFV